ncbi:MAG: hypothetical protein KJI72_01485 [Patescibacteria group bacterium]|nr:hypothetical protein [Patescibacteria group bacterium]
MDVILKKIKTAPKAPFFLGVLVLVALIGGGGTFLKNKSGNTPDPNLTSAISSGLRTTDPIKARNYWAERIDAVGAKRAYEEFKETYYKEHFGIQHTLAHVMGELLYEKESVQGLTVCDATFAFGCYHSFFGRVLSEHGIAIIPELDKACVEKFGPLGTGCQHGIGHGLREFMGSEKLVDALEACILTTQLKDLFGCTSGIFMENNVPIVISADKPAYTEPRTLNPNNPYEPCNTIVPEQFRNSCYYEMAQWWNQVFNRNWEKMGRLCEEVGNEEYTKSCYFGIGNITAPSSQYEVEATINKCKQMPSREAEVTCRSGASWSFFAEPIARDKSPEICKGLGAEIEQKCAKESDLIGNGEKFIQ